MRPFLDGLWLQAAVEWIGEFEPELVRDGNGSDLLALADDVLFEVFCFDGQAAVVVSGGGVVLARRQLEFGIVVEFAGAHVAQGLIA